MIDKLLSFKLFRTALHYSFIGLSLGALLVGCVSNELYTEARPVGDPRLTQDIQVGILDDVREIILASDINGKWIANVFGDHEKALGANTELTIKAKTVFVETKRDRDVLYWADKAGAEYMVAIVTAYSDEEKTEILECSNAIFGSNGFGELLTRNEEMNYSDSLEEGSTAYLTEDNILLTVRRGLDNVSTYMIAYDLTSGRQTDIRDVLGLPYDTDAIIECFNYIDYPEEVKPYIVAVVSEEDNVFNYIVKYDGGKFEYAYDSVEARENFLGESAR